MTAPQERLESWKAIARYLRRGVRTVRRWEQQEGMPVHRHAHRDRASVFALRSEIDAWQAARVAPAAARVRAATAPQAIAVLAFENLSPDPANAHFAAGLTEEITSTLSQMGSLRVTSRASVLALGTARATAPALARRLRTRYLLTGSVRRHAGRLRIAAQLVDGRADTHVWADTFEGKLQDVFALQERLARQIAAALRLRLSAREDQRLAARPIASVVAYECYLRARQQGWRWRPASIDRAVQLLGQALESAPDSAPLHAALGMAYLQYREAGLDLSERPLEQAQRCAEQLRALAPGSAADLRLRGWLGYARGRIQVAVRDLSEALAAEPNDADTLLLLCNCYIISGRVPAARPLLKRLASVDPLTPVSLCMPGFAAIMEGRCRRALQPYRQMYESDPANPLARLFYAWVLLHNGRRRAAAALLQRAGAEVRHSLPGWIMGQLALALGGRLPPEPEPLSPHLQAAAVATDLYPRFLAQTYALAGQSAPALRWLKVAIERGFINYPYLARHDPCFRRLRRDERFRRLLGLARARWQAFEV